MRQPVVSIDSDNDLFIRTAVDHTIKISQSPSALSIVNECEEMRLSIDELSKSSCCLFNAAALFEFNDAVINAGLFQEGFDTDARLITRAVIDVQNAVMRVILMQNRIQVG